MLADGCYHGLDLSKLVELVFIDLKRAFDTVDHKILCKKLSSIEFKTVNSLAVNPISPAASNFAGLMV